MDDNEDLLTILNKLFEVASFIGHEEIIKWIKDELEGYSNREDIPDYRKITFSSYSRERGQLNLLNRQSAGSKKMNSDSLYSINVLI